MIEALRSSDLFRLMVPRRYGGFELDLDTFLEVGLALGEGDASMAWVATFYIEHNWILCQFPEPFQEALLGRQGYALAPAALSPNGVAVPVEGGFRLNGRWQWGTGIMHADWVIVGARAVRDGGFPEFRFLALPREQVKVEDVWFVDGMIGTGSNDILIDGAFIPAERAVSIAEMAEGHAPGSRIHASPLYHTPMIPILVLAASMPVVGQARAIVRGFHERLQTHVRPGPALVKLGEKPAAQMRLAKAAIEVRQAELALRDLAAEVSALRNRATHEQRARWMATGAHAVHQARRVIQDVSEGSGASAHFQQHALQRALRDANMASCHVVFDLDTSREVYGKLLLGMPVAGALY